MISSMMSKSYLLLSGTRFLVDLGDSLIFALVIEMGFRAVVQEWLKQIIWRERGQM